MNEVMTERLEKETSKEHEAFIKASISTLTDKLRVRYSDAYNDAQAVVSIGKSIKRAGVFLFCAAFTLGIFELFAPDRVKVALIIMAAGVVVGIPVYILGILVAAIGQQQLAILDTAVNSSRHLTNDDVARVLSKRFSF